MKNPYDSFKDIQNFHAVVNVALFNNLMSSNNVGKENFREPFLIVLVHVVADAHHGPFTGFFLRDLNRIFSVKFFVGFNTSTQIALINVN